jgi:N-hydroxyarylamine O-acetyltransferase
VRLDLEGLQDKLVRRRRGGYCFEHATLFAAMLRRLGFSPVTHAARVVVARPKEESPRGHMFLTVTLEGERYVVDPGFAAYTARRPLPLRPGNPDGNDAHIFTHADGRWTLHARRDGTLVPGWITTLEEEYPVDFEMANHWTATCPSSPFLQIMMMSAATKDGRVNVMNREVTVIGPNGAVKKELTDRRELRALLADHFGFDLPEAETLVVPAIADWR